MALITINEVKRQRPSNIEASASVKQLEAVMSNVVRAINRGLAAYTVLTRLGFDEPRLLNNVRGVKDPNEAISRIYNYILHAEGDGVLKEYGSKVIRHKGTAIGGMECHSPR